MGCDIHAHFEIKVAGKWEHYTIPDIGRNYPLFERMAGVRGDNKNAMAAPRGLPDDISIVTALDANRWEGDGHSHSWLSALEIAQLEEWGIANLKLRHDYLRQWDMEMEWHCYFFSNSFAGFTRYPSDNIEGIEDLRIVFWFDN